MHHLIFPSFPSLVFLVLWGRGGGGGSTTKSPIRESPASINLSWIRRCPSIKKSLLFTLFHSKKWDFTFWECWGLSLLMSLLLKRLDFFSQFRLNIVFSLHRAQLWKNLLWGEDSNYSRQIDVYRHTFKERFLILSNSVFYTFFYNNNW